MGNTEYYYLKKGEIIQDGDEVDVCRDGWRDDPVWVKAKCIGGKAPDPQCVSHRRYRRHKTEQKPDCEYYSDDSISSRTCLNPDGLWYCCPELCPLEDES